MGVPHRGNEKSLQFAAKRGGAWWQYGVVSQLQENRLVFFSERIIILVFLIF